VGSHGCYAYNGKGTPSTHCWKEHMEARDLLLILYEERRCFSWKNIFEMSIIFEANTTNLQQY